MKAIFLITLSLSLCGFSFLVNATETKSVPVAESSQALVYSSTAPIRIKADRVTINRDKDGGRVAVYSGNVIVVQTTLRIVGEHLKMQTREGQLQFLDVKGTPASLINRDSGQAIDASAKRIIYYPKNGWLELSGGLPKVHHQKDIIEGRLIRYNVKTEEFDVEGYQDRPATLIITPTQ